MRRQAKAPSAFTPGRSAGLALALAALALLALTPAAFATKKVDHFFPINGASGGLDGQFNNPRDIDVNQASTPSQPQDGWLYVADVSNNRIQVFDSSGAFKFAIGSDVVFTGPDNAGTNEVQTVTVKATSGTFTLTFSGQTTTTLPYNATAGEVHAALNALSSIGGASASVTVGGGPGSESGSIPYTVTFGGSLAGTNVAQITIGTAGLGIPVGANLTCTPGPASATTKNIQWLRNGAPIPGATTATYTTVAADEGKAVQCQVFALNANAGATQVSSPGIVTSPAPGTAPPAPPTSISTTLTGSLGVGSTPTPPGSVKLTCNPGAWSGSPTFSYQWYRNGVALVGNGADASEYSVQAADLATAATFQCAVTGTNAGGAATLVSGNRNTSPSPSPTAPAAAASVPIGSSTATQTAGVPAAEVCTAANGDVCKAGLSGSAAGMFSNAVGLAVDQSNSHLYVRDAGNLRVQEFTATGSFVRMWGGDVIASGANGNGTAFEVCDVTNGNAASDCKVGVAGSGGPAGQFASNTAGTGIAVSPLDGHVLVVDPTNRRIQEFNPANAPATSTFVRAWGPGVGTGSTENFEVCTIASGCNTGVLGLLSNANGFFTSNSPTHLGVDSLGIIYAFDPSGYSPPAFHGPRVVRISSTLAPASGNANAALLPDVNFGNTGSFAGGTENTPTAIKVDPDSDGAGPDVNRLYVARGSTTAPGAATGIEEYDINGATPVLTDAHMPNSTLAQNGIAFNSALGTLYATSTSGSAHRVYVLDDDGASGAPDVTLDPPFGVGAHTASFSGTVNPGGFPTTYRFQVSKNGVNWVDVAPDASLGEGTEAVSVPLIPAQGQTTTLEAGTLYRVRILLTRGFGNGSVPSPELFFATDAVAPEVTTLPSPGASSSAVYLLGTVNPNGLNTTYHFEYGGTVAYGSKAPVPDASAGSGVSAQDVGQLLSGLVPNRVYHYRLCAENAEGTACGADQSFITRAAPSTPPNQGCPNAQLRGGASAGLPDCRAYELVTPADKPTGPGIGKSSHGSEEDGAKNLIAGNASANGDRFVATSDYGANLSGEGEMVYSIDPVLIDRTATGWVSHDSFNRFDYAPTSNAVHFGVLGFNDSFSTLVYENNYGGPEGRPRLFPELLDDSYFCAGALEFCGPRYLRDWSGNWRFIDGDNNSTAVIVSDDGHHIAFDEETPGTLGAEDPSADQLAGTESAAVIDLPASGISGTFADHGITSLLGVCTGSGADRTRLPEVDGSGQLTSRACPAAAPGRDAALIDSRGSAMTTDAHNKGDTDPLDSQISSDGSRVFFMSPDPAVEDVTDPGCSGTGAATACPIQLYVRQRDPDGSFITRWISRSAITGQAASLMAPAYFEGASANGDKVFFKTAAPLTADDPNGSGVAPPPGGVIAGGPSPSSWDLYEYDIPSDAEGHANDSDPGDGTLTRISAGPLGSGDCNVAPSHQAFTKSLRFASDFGTRAYFTCAAPLPGVPGASDGTVTSPGGSPGTLNANNLYLYDSARPPAQRWEFIARLPRQEGSLTQSRIESCASLYSSSSGPSLGGQTSSTTYNCMRGTPDGGFLSFFTTGRLSAEDPDSTSADIYAFDVDADTLTRVDAPQGGAGGTYACGDVASCYADPGRSSHFDSIRSINRVVATDPQSGEPMVFFESLSRLLPEDTDQHFDVYQWRAGDLSLISRDIEDTGAFYASNDISGRNVFFATFARLTWQDIDGARDNYVARVGGGFVEPPSPMTCNVLGDACQGTPAAPAGAAAAPPTAAPSAGNVSEAQAKKKKKKKRAKGKAKKHKRAKHAKRRAAK